MADETEHLCALERHLLRPSVRADADQLRRLLHEEFTEFGASGRVFDREQIVAALLNEPGTGIECEDMQAREVAPGVVLVTYRTAGGAPTTLRSSLWVDRGGDWRMLFHQGTVVP